MSPLGGADKIFGTNVMFGFMLMSSLERKFIFEGGFNVRINSNDKNINYNYEGSNVTVNSSATGFIGGAVGYKIFDNDKCILIPKGIIGILQIPESPNAFTLTDIMIQMVTIMMAVTTIVWSPLIMFIWDWDFPHFSRWKTKNMSVLKLAIIMHLMMPAVKYWRRFSQITELPPYSLDFNQIDHQRRS